MTGDAAWWDSIEPLTPRDIELMTPLEYAILRRQIFRSDTPPAPPDSPFFVTISYRI